MSRELRKADTSRADLTFAPYEPSMRKANVKSKALLTINILPVVL
jgi:hypothetical protein